MNDVATGNPVFPPTATLGKKGRLGTVGERPGEISRGLDAYTKVR